ncbi:alpha/beta fold hydrolase [Chenggangzhangella methanolivorans]|uniref:Alpha/beta hydrolase n=1 Tax=Chenggangzhangella methanolivorans TaxID=1437009 RepID=A0A9E6UMJ9_9HYPH|nr:alpha/beta hydrolase [Chenggangzhangella methanolivorans]QZO01772.1 alpha/beta hydrolase [Chenggangzhangella methanolivorans]
MKNFLLETDVITVDGLSIRYAKGGTSKGPPLLLTSPWPQSVQAFHAIWPLLQDVGPLVAVDLPGFGRSQFRADLMTPATMGGFIVKIAEAFGLKRVHAVSPDIGTSAALFAASQKPSMFESVIVGSGGTSMDLVGAGLRSVIEGPLSEIDGGSDGQIVADRIKRLSRNQPPADALEDYRLSSAEGRYKAAAAYVRAYPSDLPRLHDLLPSIKTPTLVISGKTDPLVPPGNGDLLVEGLPHARGEIVDAGHFVWEDEPEIYAGLIVDWVRGGSQSLIAETL